MDSSEAEMDSEIAGLGSVIELDMKETSQEHDVEEKSTDGGRSAQNDDTSAGEYDVFADNATQQHQPRVLLDERSSAEDCLDTMKAKRDLICINDDEVDDGGDGDDDDDDETTHPEDGGGGDDDAEDDNDDDGAMEKFEDDEKYLLSDSSSDTETNDDPVQIVPKVNCPEKIILCLDLSAEMNSTPFISKDGTKYQSLQMVKRAINIFVHTKAAMSRSHQCALVVLQDNALWMHNFTNNMDEICYILADLENETEYDSFDMSSLFDLISERIKLPTVQGDIQTIPPPYIIRTIIIYGRSHCMPEFSTGRQVMQSLMQSPYFFLDAFYIHEMPCEDNKCEAIFDRLCDLDERGTSYVFEVGRNPTYLHDNMAKLAAHPLQRPIQKDITYSLS